MRWIAVFAGLVAGAALPAWADPGITATTELVSTTNDDGGVVATHVVVRVAQTEASPGLKPPPRSVTVVLDRSGSMRGDKMWQAKRAIAGLIEGLSQDDRISVVSFAKEAHTDLASTPITISRRVRGHGLKGIDARGATNISAGLEAGFQEALQGASPHVRRLVLISDGEATHGITDPWRLCVMVRHAHQKGVTVSTVGVGDRYASWVLEHLARCGGGWMMDAGEPELLGDLLLEEARDMRDGVGASTEVQLTPAPGVELEREFVQVDDLALGEVRIVTVPLELDPDTVDPDLPLVDVQVGAAKGTLDVDSVRVIPVEAP